MSTATGHSVFHQHNQQVTSSFTQCSSFAILTACWDYKSGNDFTSLLQSHEKISAVKPFWWSVSKCRHGKKEFNSGTMCSFVFIHKMFMMWSWILAIYSTMCCFVSLFFIICRSGQIPVTTTGQNRLNELCRWILSLKEISNWWTCSVRHIPTIYSTYSMLDVLIQTKQNCGDYEKKKSHHEYGSYTSGKKFSAHPLYTGKLFFFPLPKMKVHSVHRRCLGKSGICTLHSCYLWPWWKVKEDSGLNPQIFLESCNEFAALNDCGRRQRGLYRHPVVRWGKVQQPGDSWTAVTANWPHLSMQDTRKIWINIRHPLRPPGI